MSLKRSINSISNKFENISGSSPRSSEGIYKTASTIKNKASSLFSPKKSSSTRLLSDQVDSLRTISKKSSDKMSSLFSPKKSSSTRLLSEPAETLSKAASNISQSVSSAVPDLSSISNSSLNMSDYSTTGVSGGISFWQYLLIILILIFMGITLFLFLLKPTDKDITHLYDPLLEYFNKTFNTNFKIGGKTQHVEKEEKKEKVSIKKNEAAVHKLEKALNEKEVINKIDNKHHNKTVKTQETDLLPTPVKKYKKLPVIPEADETMSRIQMKPTSNSGFCYIGEDRGFRSCIEVGEGDVCMSGDIFPTETICINPNLRE